MVGRVFAYIALTRRRVGVESLSTTDKTVLKRFGAEMLLFSVCYFP
jgi:hypothetical protein